MNTSMLQTINMELDIPLSTREAGEEERGTQMPGEKRDIKQDRENPFLASLTPMEREQFYKLNPPFVSYNEKDLIIRQGERHRILYLLLKGSVSVTRPEHAMVLARLKPGEFFGEMSFLTNTPRHTHVVAEERSMVIKITYEMFQALTPAVQNKIREHLIQLLVKRLDGMNEAMLKIAKFASDFALR